MKTWCILAGLALISAMLIAGCVGIRSPGGGSGSGTQTIDAQASDTPTLSALAPSGTVGLPAVLIVDPPFDGGVSSGTVTVSVQVTDFALVPPGGPNRQGTGHLVYYRDVFPEDRAWGDGAHRDGHVQHLVGHLVHMGGSRAGDPYVRSTDRECRRHAP